MSVPTETVTSRWRSKLQVPAGGRAHWDTRAAYYRAVCELLAEGKPVTWQRVVAAVRPHGSRTTFYDVAGPKAKYPLLGALLEAGTPWSLNLVWAYRRDGAAATLVDEAKVWSFWPHRESWLAAARRGDGTDGLRDALADWSLSHPQVARANDAVPPICAVEDLVVSTWPRVSVRDGIEQLAAVIRQKEPAARVPAAR